MSNNSVYEIMRMMQDSGAMQNDMTEAMEVVQNMFKKKYINKMHEVVRTHQLEAKNNPPKEIQLMSALMPFMPEANRKNMDQMIDMMLTLHAAKNIQTELSDMDMGRGMGMNAPKMPPRDVSASSIHEDGVYDMDNACLSNQQMNAGNMTGLMLVLALSKMKK